MAQLANESILPIGGRLDELASEAGRHAACVKAANGRRAGAAPAPAGAEGMPDEREFMLAMKAYQVSSGRMFPTWSEVLEVLQTLGYAKPALAATATG